MTEYHPKTFTHPGAVLRELLKERNQSVETLVTEGDARQQLWGIVEGRLPIKRWIAVLLEMKLGVRTEYWLEHQRLYDEHKPDTE